MYFPYEKLEHNLCFSSVYVCVRASVRVLKVHALCFCVCVRVCVYRGGVGSEGGGWGQMPRFWA